MLQSPLQGYKHAVINPSKAASTNLCAVSATCLLICLAAALAQGASAPVCSAMFGQKRIEPGPGQESVWDYPRPPACEPTNVSVQVYLGGKVLADTRRAYRVLETSHPPVYYIPQDDIQMQKLKKSSGQSTYCEWKGSATYFDGPNQRGIAWCYENPTKRFSAIKDYLAFYPSKVDKATVDGEVVRAQEGDFYGGWVTKNIVGPFKGGAGTWGW